MYLRGAHTPGDAPPNPTPGRREQPRDRAARILSDRPATIEAEDVELEVGETLDAPAGLRRIVVKAPRDDH